MAYYQLQNPNPNLNSERVVNIIIIVSSLKFINKGL